jgi:hypothetical protein
VKAYVLEEHLASIFRVETEPALLAISFVLVSCLAYSSSLKLWATWLSEMSFDFRRTTTRYIPEGITLPVILFFSHFLSPSASVHLLPDIYFAYNE